MTPMGGAPELIVEILLPGDTVMELTQKLREYFAIGVRLVWVTDPRTRTILAYPSLTDVRAFREPDRLPGDDGATRDPSRRPGFAGQG
jgi:Uma2 family endonuclease